MVLKYVNVLLVIVALVGIGWIFTLPSKADCVTSGRVVDPTERHCQSADGYQQLQEHALFHSTQVVLGAAVLWTGAFLVDRRRRKAKV
jgi:hypothetical protein